MKQVFYLRFYNDDNLVVSSLYETYAVARSVMIDQFCFYLSKRGAYSVSFIEKSNRCYLSFISKFSGRMNRKSFILFPTFISDNEFNDLPF